MSLTPIEQITIEAYDAAAASWASAHDSDVSYWQAEIDRFRELCPPGNLLEVGCGSARDAMRLINLGYGYLGTDISVNMLAEARTAAPSATFQQRSIYSLNLAGYPPFDGFWACAMMLHLPKRRIGEALSEIARYVRPSGTGFISLLDGKGERLVESDFRGVSMPRFFAFWTRTEFEAAIDHAGYRVVDYCSRPAGDTGLWHGFFVQTPS